MIDKNAGDRLAVTLLCIRITTVSIPAISLVQRIPITERYGFLFNLKKFGFRAGLRLGGHNARSKNRNQKRKSNPVHASIVGSVWITRRKQGYSNFDFF